MTNFRPRRLMQEPPLFFMDIGAWSAPQGGRFEWLDEKESAMSERFGSSKRRAQFAAGRWLLHYAAREVFGAARYEVETREDRPVLTVEPTGSPAALSLSHAGEFILCGVAPSGSLGVDVELIRPRKQWEGVAEFALHPAERRRLSRLADRDLWPGFYRLWTLKEALSKALGAGLAMPFNRICISEGGSDGSASIEDAPGDCGLGESPWTLRTIDAPAGVAAAVAWREAAV